MGFPDFFKRDPAGEAAKPKTSLPWSVTMTAPRRLG
jgi:hypothetical protein